MLRPIIGCGLDPQAGPLIWTREKDPRFVLFYIRITSDKPRQSIHIALSPDQCYLENINYNAKKDMAGKHSISPSEAFITWQFVQYFSQVQVLVEQHGSSVLQTIMNTQRTGRASSKANEKPCGEFPSQMCHPVFLQ